MVIFVRSYLSEYDSKMQKYFRSLEISRQRYRFIGWMKGSNTHNAAHYFGTLYINTSPLGGGFRNAFSLILWNIFILRSLFALRLESSVIHAVDLDSAVACFIFARVFRKKFIFDIYDKYSAVRTLGRRLSPIADRVEHYISRRSDLVIIASDERIVQHGLEQHEYPLLVLENIPGGALVHAPPPPYRGKWSIGYFGVLERTHRGLEDLLELARKRDGIELHIVGYGALEATVRQVAERSDNVIYHGVAHSDNGLSIMQNMHVMAGLYYRTIANHAYAAPNKYYEHLMLGRPLLTTCFTSPGLRVAAHGTGWAVEEGLDALDKWFSQLDESSVAAAGINARRLWEEQYHDYFDKHYVKNYSLLIGQMRESHL